MRVTVAWIYRKDVPGDGLCLGRFDIGYDSLEGLMYYVNEAVISKNPYLHVYKISIRATAADNLVSRRLTQENFDRFMDRRYPRQLMVFVREHAASTQVCLFRSTRISRPERRA